jgi:hypothetical protein
MITDAWSDKEITISKIKAPVVTAAPCPMSGKPVPKLSPPWVVGSFETCPDCLRVVSVRPNGNFYRHVARQFSDPRDVIVVQTGTKVIEIDASDVPAFIGELQAVLTSRSCRPYWLRTRRRPKQKLPKARPERFGWRGESNPLCH